MTEMLKSKQNSNNHYVAWIIFILVILGLTLPFHYVPSQLRMFPKEHFTFKNTIITEEDINKIIETYNNASNIFEQNTFNNDPFIKTLREQEILVTETKHKTISKDIIFLTNFKDKYPHDVDLLNIPIIKKRLENLIGNKYFFLTGTCHVETPIKIENDEFITEGCQAHNCDATNYIILINLLSNNMYVGIREEQNVRLYSEDGSTSSYLTKWKKEAEQSSTRTISEDIVFLTKFKDKLPYDVDLLNIPIIKKRLDKLIGNKYSVLKDTCHVETPIKIDNDEFIAEACQAHNCNATNYIILINLSSNVMYVGIREEQNVRLYSEDGSTSSYLTKWKMDN